MGGGAASSDDVGRDEMWGLTPHAIITSYQTSHDQSCTATLTCCVHDIPVRDSDIHTPPQGVQSRKAHTSCDETLFQQCPPVGKAMHGS